jgi:hypothetical protein
MNKVILNFMKKCEKNINNNKNYIECSLHNDVDSPIDNDYIHIEQDDIKRKLNQVLEYVNVPITNDM